MSVGDVAPLGALEEQILVAVLHTGDAACGMAVRRELERRDWDPPKTT